MLIVYETKGVEMWWELKISLITVSHTASLNLRNFELAPVNFAESNFFWEIWRISLITISHSGIYESHYRKKNVSINAYWADLFYTFTIFNDNYNYLSYKIMSLELFSQ